MDTSFLVNSTFAVATHIASVLLLFVATLLLSSAMRLNKGAKANRAWAAVAIGLILIALAEASEATTHLGYPLLEDWDGLLVGGGALFVMLGAILWRGIVKKANR